MSSTFIDTGATDTSYCSRCSETNLLTLTFDGEGLVAGRVLLAHVHWHAVLLGRADVPVRALSRHEGAGILPCIPSEEEKPHHVAVLVYSP